jgi:hypothetical protein
MRSGSGLEIVAVSVNGNGHGDIAHIQWRSASSSGITSPHALILWLREDPEHEAWLVDGERRIAVEVVTPIDAAAHLRSRLQGEWGDHLLGLPRF